MGIFRQRHFKATLGFAVIAIAVVIAGASMVVAKGFGGYDQVPSADDLKQARGVVYDWATTDSGEWVISGEWVLDCHGPCANAKLHNIEFDMAWVMVRPGGANSHSHQFSGFSATAVTLDGDNLTIDGEITGSGPIGTDEITIKLTSIADGNATFFFKMDEGNIIRTEIGGAIVESR